ncbi:MliC family protein [Novilysobacter erysipheiresistens]|uniref:MliC family protein n=1 Tax=Novilysobacter erysipheiresistens TaxID=1749332 RepID=A0ABU7Z0Y8_9GAMM
MILPAATPRLTLLLSLAIVLVAGACQPKAGHDDPVPAATPARADATATTATFHWQCGEVGVASTYNDDARRVILAFSGRELELPIAVSASGARYADTAGNEFWTKGDSGTLTLAAEAGSETAKRECARSERPSPWFQAAERGVGFRAGGGEPGWHVEVDRGEAPELRATLDYGEREIEVARTEASATNYTGATADGTTVVLSIDRTRCQDGMSGEWFEAGATLEVGDRSYNGCGAFLFE